MSTEFKWSINRVTVHVACIHALWDVLLRSHRTRVVRRRLSWVIFADSEKWKEWKYRYLWFGIDPTDTTTRSILLIFSVDPPSTTMNPIEEIQQPQKMVNDFCSVGLSFGWLSLLLFFCGCSNYSGFFCVSLCVWLNRFIFG